MVTLDLNIELVGIIVGVILAIYAPIGAFLIRVGRDVEVIKTLLSNLDITVSSHEKEADKDSDRLDLVIQAVEVLKVRMDYVEGRKHPETERRITALRRYDRKRDQEDRSGYENEARDIMTRDREEVDL